MVTRRHLLAGASMGTAAMLAGCSSSRDFLFRQGGSGYEDWLAATDDPYTSFSVRNPDTLDSIGFFEETSQDSFWASPSQISLFI
ncbi:MAG: hypothetical protein U5K37_08975 [Natrialbaceae archaeon]|nr:hypothetical protein [Natrialbaceae archaeon]